MGIILTAVPLAVASVALGYVWYGADMDAKWKLVATAVVVLSVCFQFVPPMKLHPLVPLLMQCFVGIWMVIHLKMN